jgi:hypothetical protein
MVRQVQMKPAARMLRVTISWLVGLRRQANRKDMGNRTAELDEMS